MEQKILTFSVIFIFLSHLITIFAEIINDHRFLQNVSTNSYFFADYGAI